MKSYGSASLTLTFNASAIYARIVLIGIMRDSHQPADSRDSITLPVFGKVEPEHVISRDRWFVVIQDKYPVSIGHSLIIPWREVHCFQDLSQREKTALLHWISWTQKYLVESLVPVPDAFNIGANDGHAAGQTIGQFHFHIIPRYKGDVSDPRGGIRWVIPPKARYW
jgi:diadenosine tetraphosphate (Ap4A) HIT family hydrolase